MCLKSDSSRCRVTVALGLLVALVATNVQAQAVVDSKSKPAPPAPLESAPRLVLSRTNWDFGQKWVGEPVAMTEILLKNEGHSDLVIDDVRTTCGCAAVAPKSGGTWKGKVLAPNASEIMTIAFNTARPVTNVSRTITVLSSDPVRPRAVINIAGNVLNPLTARPHDRIAFGKVLSTARLAQEIELVNTTGGPVKLKLRPPAPDSPFDLKLTEIEEGKLYRLMATTRPPLSAGASMIEVELETGVAKFPLQHVQVSAFVSAPAFVTPAKLFAELTTPIQRLLRLSYQTSKPIRITEIRSSHPDLIKAELMTMRPPAGTNRVQEFSDHNIRVSLPPGSQLPPSGAVIEIHTNDPTPEYQKFTVPIELLRKPGAAVAIPAPGAVAASARKAE